MQHREGQSCLARRQANEQQPAISDEGFRIELLSLVPSLRAFSRSLCRNHDLAHDLAQDTLCKAWQARSHFRLGTNLKAWLFKILCNQFYSHRRSARREQAWDEETSLGIATAADEQDWAARLSDTTRALELLSSEQREALILVTAGGFSYHDAASICQCPVGTIKSRVARARKTMLGALEDGSSLRAVSRPAIGRAAHTIMAELNRLTSQYARNAPSRLDRTSATIAIAFASNSLQSKS